MEYKSPKIERFEDNPIGTYLTGSRAPCKPEAVLSKEMVANEEVFDDEVLDDKQGIVREVSKISSNLLEPVVYFC